MGTRSNPGAFDCYANAHPDEPMFVLLGRDRFAPSLVDLWAIARQRNGEPATVVNDALDVASEMRNWLYLSKKRELKVVQFISTEVLIAELSARTARERIAAVSAMPSDFAPSAPITLDLPAGEWPAGKHANGAHVRHEQIPGIPGEPDDSEGGTPE